MNEYKAKVRFEGVGYVTLTAQNGDELCNKIVKGEGYDNQLIEDMRITEVEMIRIVSCQECKMENENG